jgi:hypothetical protein
MIRKILDSYGAYYFMPFGGGYGHMGVPDFVGCKDGKFFAVEAKAGKGKTTALQDRELNAVRAAGGIALVINENNLEDLNVLRQR